MKKLAKPTYIIELAEGTILKHRPNYRYHFMNNSTGNSYCGYDFHTAQILIINSETDRGFGRNEFCSKCFKSHTTNLKQLWKH